MEIPKEDPASENPRLIARLVRSLHGTRDAPQLWTKHVGGTLRELGCQETKGAPPMFSPMTAEDFKDDDRKKTEAQMKVLLQGTAGLCRRGTALAVYMSQDRPDFSAAACQLATRMQGPTEYDWERLKRFVQMC